MNGFTKRVLRIPVEKPFDEVYFTHRLWKFFRETKETEEDIRRMFHHIRERMKLRITLKKKSDPGKFAIPCVVNLVELGNDLGYIAACHCGAEYETDSTLSHSFTEPSRTQEQEHKDTRARERKKWNELFSSLSHVPPLPLQRTDSLAKGIGLLFFFFFQSYPAQERLGDELKTLVDDIYQPLDRGYNELFRSMVEMRT
ncbi:hypothetical protein F2Q70_00003988 [Brassica cretica]|uniref:Uncharacterized protein n=1 Tax=Brassica cretica TaxID=69181 RepID=A0A8S9J1A0_BRACR|nr:hypothetical protein F2Q70_00003988 [Brassica cretica]